MGKIYVIIPSYEPTGALIKVCRALKQLGVDFIVVVDDGSGERYQDVFQCIERDLGCMVVRHAVNLGKGRALKTAFNHLLLMDKTIAGVVTADSDGQHTPNDIKRVMDSLEYFSDSLVMGVRNFKGENVPWKSWFGNELTRKICAFLCGVEVSDTQTGLRGIPRKFMEKFLSTQGERFDYETNMLLECSNGIHIHEIAIQTVYDSKTNHKTHFDPLIDSMMIYKVILTYSFSSVVSTVVDFAVFAIMTGMHYSIGYATAVGRAAAALINFALNRNVVFQSDGKIYYQLFQYLLLVAVSGSISAFLVTFLQRFVPADVLAIKIVAEVLLFFLNYYVQRTVIFSQKGKKKMEDHNNRRTDWTAYYGAKKSWFSSFTQKYTLHIITDTIAGYVLRNANAWGVQIAELGGGSSCFAEKICDSVPVETYDIFDNNELSVRLFHEMQLKAKCCQGNLVNLLEDGVSSPQKKYDFVYSIGLIEHFRGQDIRTMIHRHFDYCKSDGIVLISFPTPTTKYRFVRKCMEMVGQWRFYDEEPLRYEEVESFFSERGTILADFVNGKLPLSQMVVIAKKVGE